ncbi:MAG: 1-acyl-sn-glycerol-3-phosphate acyltransferase [Succinivibrio sp.]|nr:1-acyl-sn-glycerol-3-phosphate acyltransferase [Succinivibrio sp.]
MSSEKQQAQVSSSVDPFFDDIRPCTDNEVEAELAKVINDKTVINSILRFRYPILSHFFSYVLTPLVRHFLTKKVEKIHSVDDFQLRVSDFMDHVIATTTTSVEYVGFDKLKKDVGYVFISNHRDISLDPAFIDKALIKAGLKTARIAIGDNLLRLPAATSLMRMNKSFIVKRSVVYPREKLQALRQLSSYIGISVAEGNSIWIAEREGRAKDGNDRCEEAVLKMIALYGKVLKQDFKTYMESLNIIPVSITYEYDPNAVSKAHELAEREANNGEYHKEEFEDIDTIIRGIKGFKGRIKLVAGEPLKGFNDASELAARIDDFILHNYAIFSTSLLSCGREEGVSKAERAQFDAYLKECPVVLRSRIKDMYARPLKNLEELNNK